VAKPVYAVITIDNSETPPTISCVETSDPDRQVTAVYYLIVRLLESKIPVFGVLLGSRKQPVYLDPK